MLTFISYSTSCMKIFKSRLFILLFFVVQVSLLLKVICCFKELSDSNVHQENHEIKNFWKFKQFEKLKWNSSQELILKDNLSKYFKQIHPNVECFIEGTDWSLVNPSSSECPCKPNYFGKDCGIPDSVWYGHYHKSPKAQEYLTPRKIPRRIIQGVLFNQEFEMLELRLASTVDVVDAFLLQESNYSSIGEPKPLKLLNELSKGWLRQYEDKIVYILLDHFLHAWTLNGWLVENYIRDHISLSGLPILRNKRDDDLFLLLDADEIPNRATLLFLKLYDGYSEPFQFKLRWNLYGFFWLKSEGGKESLTSINSGCTLGMLRQVYGNNAINIRRNSYQLKEFQTEASHYARTHFLQTWTIGALGHYAGLHCSWCFRPEGIRTKLLSAQKEDKPRWGDYPEKTKLTYIASLIKSGRWFDGSHPTIRVRESDHNFAPNYAIVNSKTFKHFLKL